MGQFDVYEFLKKNKKTWFTSKDIAKVLKVNQGSAQNALRKLLKGKFIRRREIGFKNRFEYKFKC
jgi:predicted transcriptional regulator